MSTTETEKSVEEVYREYIRSMSGTERGHRTSEIGMRANTNEILFGDCREVLSRFPDQYVDLIYLDTPFFTQKSHALFSRDRAKKYEFNDVFPSLDAYLSFVTSVLHHCHRILKNTGNLFLHCDRTASHHLRSVLETVFGEENFQSEIIWSYKR